MDPATLTLVIVAVVGAAIGGFGIGRTTGQGGDTDVTITDESRVQEQKTEQVFSYERVVADVCASDFITEHGDALCQQGLCLADQRADSKADSDTCDRAASHRAKMAARADCDDGYPVVYTESPTQAEQTLQTKQAAEHTACLAYFVVEK